MTKQELLQLKMTATRVRMGVIEATHAAKSGHPGGSLSAVDALTYLYFKEMQIDPENPQDPERDRFVLSKGHAAPGLYATLAERGFFPVEDLATLRRDGSYLEGHPNMNKVPGVDMSTGSLGQAFPPPAAWRWPPARKRRTSTSTPSWATARSRRASAGKLSCLPPTTSWTTCAS